MTLHLIKLCVGCESIRDQEDWIAERRRLAGRKGVDYEHSHTTRMVPSKLDDILRAKDGPGSLYWVIKGQIACRQEIIDIRPFTDSDGIGRCNIVMKPAVVPVEPRPCRPFQGWHYLKAADAPRDIGRIAEGLVSMPEEMRRELAGLGLL